MIITPLEDLEKEIEGIEEYLLIPTDDNPALLVEKGNELVVFLARTGKMLADAKYHQDTAYANSVIREMGRDAKIPPSILKNLVEASCKRENLLVNSLERLNRSCVHQIDWLRSLISKAKEEMKYENFGK